MGRLRFLSSVDVNEVLSATTCVNSPIICSKQKTIVGDDTKYVCLFLDGNVSPTIKLKESVNNNTITITEKTSCGQLQISSGYLDSIFTVSQDGKIGINTSSPSSVLDVNANNTSIGVRIIQNNSNGYGLYLKPGSDDKYALLINNAAENQNAHTFYGSGNALISYNGGQVAIGGDIVGTYKVAVCGDSYLNGVVKGTSSCWEITTGGCACFKLGVNLATNALCLNGQPASSYSITAHTHGNINTGGCIGSTAGCVLCTSTNGCVTVVSPSSLTVGNATNATTANNSECLSGLLTTCPPYYFSRIPKISSDGVMEVGKYIDFHEVDGNSCDYYLRLESVDNLLKINNSNGYGILGSENQYYFHFRTDRPAYYFNKKIVVDEGIISSYDDDLQFQAGGGVTRMRISNSTGYVGICGDLDVCGNIQLNSFYIKDGANTAYVDGGYGIAPAGNITALFNKDIYRDHLAFKTPASAEYNNGSGWVSTTVPRNLFMGAIQGNVTIQNGWTGYRITFNNLDYDYYEAFFISFCTENNYFTVKLEKSANGSDWTEIFTTGEVTGWPGTYTHKKYFTTVDTPYLRITITPRWTNSNNIYIYNIRAFGIYNQTTTDDNYLFVWDADKKVCFYNKIDVPSNSGNGGYISSGNYGGTGCAAYFPEGIWSNGTQAWIYGTINTNGCIRNTSSCWSITADGNGYFKNGICTPRVKGDDVLYLCTDAGYNVHIMNGSEYMAQFCGNGGAYLYYDNALKLYTISNGICVNGCGIGTDFIATSDIKLKTDINPISNALSTITQLKGVKYKLCSEINNGFKCKLGLIAQEVCEHVPEVVYENDGYLGITYDKLVPVLIEAIKELKNCIDSQQKYIYKLEDRFLNTL